MSNLLKQCYVVSSGTGTRIINSNDGVRQKLKELQQEQAPEQVPALEQALEQVLERVPEQEIQILWN